MLKPFIISGLALGGVYGLSAVGLSILYRVTGVVNFAYGAFGAFAALLAWQLTENGIARWPSYGLGVLAAGAISTIYGAYSGRRLADRDDLVKGAASLGAALVVLGAALIIFGSEIRVLNLPTTEHSFQVWGVYVTLTQALAFGLAIALTVLASLFLRYTRTGVQMRALACDRELAAMLGVKVSLLEIIAWLVSGLVGGVTGILLANLVALEGTTLTFLVITSLAAAAIGGFRRLPVVLGAALVIGQVQAILTPYGSVSSYRNAAPFVIAFIALPLFQRRIRDRGGVTA